MPAETRKLLKMWSAARDIGDECALATVVHVAGSSYRKPGARMLIARSGLRTGTVSGGCLEDEVTRKIWWLTEDGPAVQDYATSYDDDSLQSYGLGCDGVVTLLLERTAHAADLFEALRLSVEDRVPSAIVTIIGTNSLDIPLGARFVLPANAAAGFATRAPSDLHQQLLPIAVKTLSTRQSCTISVKLPAGSVELFAEYIAPPPALFVFGAGDDAKPVVHLAHSMGWEVSALDGRSNLATPARFPLAHRVSVISPDALNDLGIQAGDAAVVLTHSYIQDVAILRALLPLRLGYLGILGPRRRTERIVEEVAAAIGMTPEQALDSLKSPVGLDLGAGSPDVIALSIVAEIQAVLTRRSAAPLNLSAAASPSLLASSLHD